MLEINGERYADKCCSATGALRRDDEFDCAENDVSLSGVPAALD